MNGDLWWTQSLRLKKIKYAGAGDGTIDETYDCSSRGFFGFYLTLYFLDFAYFGYFYFLSALEGDLSLLLDFDLSDLASSPFFLLF